VLASDTPYIRSTFNASQRFFSTGSCPFKVLQVSRGSTYAEAKKSFLKVAMHHHPDTIQQRLDPDDEHYEETLKKSVDKFMTARKAFEGLVEGDDGVCLLRSDVEIVEELQMTDQQFE
jgi:DnaJ-class molecular chaperone